MRRGTRVARAAGPAVGAVAAVGVAVTALLDGTVVCGGREEALAAADCPLRAEYDGRTYHDGVTLKDFTVGERLGVAVVPRCDDTGCVGEEPRETPGQATGAYRIEGIDPAVALAVGPDPESAVLVVSEGEGTDPGELSPGP
ncbi:DUF6281 family protein [Streptomyces sp. NPDC056600]|uniref:DUF6281 family protein n=1 Tax=Streptomyces sp. NPDC056600 TaxID=3345874 RepID=UPI0036C72F0F